MNFMVCFMHWGWVHEYWQRLGTGELYGLPHAQGMGAGVLQRLETGEFYGPLHAQGMGAGVLERLKTGEC